MIHELTEPSDHAINVLKRNQADQVACYNYITTAMQGVERDEALNKVTVKLKSIEHAIQFLQFLKLRYI